jgi:hypothetical protein
MEGEQIPTDPKLNKPVPEDESPIVGVLSVHAETPDGKSYVTDFLIRHPELKIEARDCELEVEKVEGLMEEFEAKHSLAELNAITELTPDLALLFEKARELEEPGRVEAAIKLYESQNPAYVEIYKAKIAKLRAIILSPEDTRKFEIRMAAKKDEAGIVDLVEKIRKETNISKERLDALQVRRKAISNAVGFINNNVVCHNR